MQDHRQPVIVGQPQLFHVEKLLPHAIEIRHEMIEADLPHGYQARVASVGGEGLVQTLEIRILRGGSEQGVDTERVAVTPLVSQQPDALEMVCRNARQHAMVHPGTRGMFAHVQAVGVELGRVQVAVGIDPGRHRVMMPQAAALDSVP